MPELVFCCEQFKAAYSNNEIMHADDFDETEWYIPEWYHLFYCPFCGKYIKGQGFGEPSVPYDEAESSDD